MVQGQQRACMPVYIGQSGDMVECFCCLTSDRQQNYMASQLVYSIKFKLSRAIGIGNSWSFNEESSYQLNKSNLPTTIPPVSRNSGAVVMWLVSTLQIPCESVVFKIFAKGKLDFWARISLANNFCERWRECCRQNICTCHPGVESALHSSTQSHSPLHLINTQVV